jgi:hypothetical protein
MPEEETKRNRHSELFSATQPGLCSSSQLCFPEHLQPSGQLGLHASSQPSARHSSPGLTASTCLKHGFPVPELSPAQVCGSSACWPSYHLSGLHSVILWIPSTSVCWSCRSKVP